MSDQILSQEEIDALLSAMAKGEVDLEPEVATKTEIKEYDFTSKSIILRDQFDALEEVYDKFTDLLSDDLTTLLQQQIEVEFVLTEMVKYGDFIKAFANPTNFNIFTAKPLIGTCLMVVEPSLVFSLIDCMFGGEGKTLDKIREFTSIENRMMKKFSAGVLKTFEEALELVYKLSLELKKTESKPEFVHMVSNNDLVIVAVFSINGKEFSGNIHFCLSYLMLDPIKDKLSSRYLREKDMEHTWNEQLQMLLRDTQVNLIAELGKTRKTVEDLIQMKVDDIIPLNTGPESLIDLKVENITKFKGYPGVVKGTRAVQIAKILGSNGREVENAGE